MRFTSRLGSVLLAGIALSGCGLTLDYDPPEDGGIDVLGVDAPLVGCRTDVDCADGDLCNGSERCVAERCEAGTPVLCDDGDVCDGVDTCDPRSGTCVTAPAAQCEDDGDPCNGAELCDALLGCTHDAPLVCDDGVGCTEDVCQAGLGCVFNPIDARCDVVTGGVCLEGGCSYPTCEVGVTCTSDDACLTPHCTSEGVCVRQPMACPTGEECCGGICVAPGCDDGLACTVDRCSRTEGCMNTPRTAGSCDDGDRCTFGDTCVSGMCVGGTVRPCLIGGDPCIAGSCDPSSGECISTPLDGVPCVDSNACTREDRCVAGVCTSGMAVICDDGEFCTADSCDEVLGCSHVPLADGITCPGIIASVCRGGHCVGESACETGTADCDGDGVCECTGACASTGSGVTCVAADDCRVSGCSLGLVCCAGSTASRTGRCYDPACLSCCMPTAG